MSTAVQASTCLFMGIGTGAYWLATYPFQDNGMRYARFPYAQESPQLPYFRNKGDKPFAVDADVQMDWFPSSTYVIAGRGTLRTPSGFDLSLEAAGSAAGTFLFFQRTEFNYGPGCATPRKFQWNIGFGNEFFVANGFSVGPTFQASFLWFMARPFSLRAHAVVAFFSPPIMGDISLMAALHSDRFALEAGMRVLVGSPVGDFYGPSIGIQGWF